MDTAAALPWLTLLLLGAVHGVNPGMGWLFAAALGLQEGKALAVWRALPALAIGHALAIAAVLVLAAFVGVVIPVETLRWVVAVTLLVFGITKLLRQRHPRYGGMRVTGRQMAVWSFLMASAHGAGLMVVPLMLAQDSTEASTIISSSDEGLSKQPGPAGAAPTGHDHGEHLAGLVTEVSQAQIAGAVATAVHTAGYLFVTALLAWLVFARFGVRILRSTWINLDLLWAIALIATALATPFLG
jgi:hypothetical protein